MADLKAFADQLVNLTVKEVNELAEILKEEYGIEPAAATGSRDDLRTTQYREAAVQRAAMLEYLLAASDAFAVRPDPEFMACERCDYVGFTKAREFVEHGIACNGVKVIEASIA